jgi:photosystem II stability/assembly factor-like uncharacterized protein
MLGFLGCFGMSSSHARIAFPENFIRSLLIGPHDQLIVDTPHGFFASIKENPEWSRIVVSIEHNAARGTVYLLYADTANVINGSVRGNSKMLWPQRYIVEAAGKGDRYYCSTERFLMRSTDGGVHWIAMGKVPLGGCDTEMAVVRDTLYVGTYHGLYKSDNHGVDWVAATDADVILKNGVSSLFANSKGHLYVYDPRYGNLKSEDSGKTWAQMDFGQLGVAGSPIVAIINDVVYATPNYRLVSSKDDGKSWAAAGAGIRYTVKHVQQSQSGMFYALTEFAIYKRARETDAWQRIPLKGIPWLGMNDD